MAKRLPMLMLSLILICAATPFLAACHATAGAGEDISKTGQAIQNSANQNMPQ